MSKQIIGISSIGMYGSQWGYTIINFILWYCIGAYISKYNLTKLKKSKNIMLLIMSVIVLFIWSLLNDKIGYFTEKSAFEYCNPVVIFEAVLVFLLFKNITIKRNKIINILSKGVFVTFLLQKYFLNIIDIRTISQLSLPLMFIGLIGICILIYTICWVISAIYNFIMKPVNKVINRFVDRIIINIE